MFVSINIVGTEMETFDSSKAARHRYLCLGDGITPVLAASLPEKPLICFVCFYDWKNAKES